eukprot:1160604-Pelagomonas_calceolata.AAC.4
MHASFILHFPKRGSSQLVCTKLGRPTSELCFHALLHAAERSPLRGDSVLCPPMQAYTRACVPCVHARETPCDCDCWEKSDRLCVWISCTQVHPETVILTGVHLRSRMRCVHTGGAPCDRDDYWRRPDPGADQGGPRAPPALHPGGHHLPRPLN